MERLSRIVCYLGWPSNGSNSTDERRPDTHDDNEKKEKKPTEITGRLCSMLESILLWENSTHSMSVVIAFNVLFWGIIVLEVRGFAAASSAALVTILCYSSLAVQAKKDERPPDFRLSQAKAEQLDKIVKMVKTILFNLNAIRKENTWVFITLVCTFSIGLWQLGRSIDGILLAYVICMGILIGPALILRIPCKGLSDKEWDSEIEEFLPAVTADNIEVLTRAGESDDHSSIKSSASANMSEMFYNDEDIAGMVMPSYDDSSVDGLDLSELELNTETDTNAIKFLSGHFERGFSSEDEDDLQLDPTELMKHFYNDNDSDSEFEIIDTTEVSKLTNV